MQYKQWLPKLSALSLVQLFLCLIAVTLAVIQWSTGAPDQWGSELQQLQEQKYDLVQALDTLKENRAIVQTMSVDTDSVDSITLSLIEAIKQQANNEQLELTRLTVTQSDDLPLEAMDNESSFRALRVNLAVTTRFAVDLLALLDVLKEAAQWRPIEVRGCSLVRLTESPVSLQASCAVDVYYFPEIDK